MKLDAPFNLDPNVKVRTRFAPSPTGYLHVGGARTALYSWLYAKHNNGEFVLRIEDTDLERSTPEATAAIIEGMEWLNLPWEHGPYYQTKRFDRYNQVIDEMIEQGLAYRCYCTKDRLEELRHTQEQNKEKPRYDRHCLHDHSHSPDEPHVVRFKNPTEGSVVFDDAVRGRIEISNSELDDLIIRRTDGSPTYNFCVVVDDWDMGITHVVRGEDHINNTPRQINILKALGAPIPTYAHVSMINGDDGQKLSKRHGAVSVMQYRDDGYLPEALINYLVRLGWGHGDQEIFSREEMIKYFELDHVSKSASAFNTEKLQWLNQHYIRELPPEYVAKHLEWHYKDQGIDTTKRSDPMAMAMIHLLGLFAELERSFIVERTSEGKRAKIAAGNLQAKGGRPPKVTPAIRQKIMKDFQSGLSILDVATRYSLSKATSAKLKGEYRKIEKN